MIETWRTVLGALFLASGLLAWGWTSSQAERHARSARGCACDELTEVCRQRSTRPTENEDEPPTSPELVEFCDRLALSPRVAGW